MITPRSVHAVRSGHTTTDLRPLAARIAGRSVGLVLAVGPPAHSPTSGCWTSWGGRGDGRPVRRHQYGGVIAAFAATGMDAAAVDAHVYEYFIRNNPLGDYTVPSKGIIRGHRSLVALDRTFGGRLEEELPKEFRCVSVDLLARGAVSSPRLVADVVGCSLRVPGLSADNRRRGAAC